MTNHASFLKFAFVCFSFVPFIACAGKSVQSETVSAKAETCTLSPQAREALLGLDYASFDQSLPKGGWRQFEACPLFTRELLDAYIAKHQGHLQKQQWDVLVWHSGQISAMAGDSADAVAKMAQTLKPNERPTDAFLWNPYAKATIAFLQKDMRALRSERKKMSLGLSPFTRLNLRHVDAFIRCFDSTYLQAYAITGCEPAETNLQRLRSLAVPFNVNKPFATKFFGLADFFKMKKMILVGEVHGTKNTPELFGNIVAAVATEKTKTLVALELPRSSQTSIDGFLRTRDENLLRKDAFFSREYQDGRSSRAMVALLKRLAKLPRVTVLCMDPMSGPQTMTGQERDTGMARLINDTRTGYDHVLVLSGNVHSSLALGTPWDAAYRPMAYELKNLAQDLGSDDLLNVLVRYGKLDSWHCESAEIASCGPHNGAEIPTEYSQAMADDSYFVWEGGLQDGHTASFFLRSAGLSKPFVQTSVPKSVPAIPR